MKTALATQLRLFGESERFKTLAMSAALAAVTGDPAKRADNERLAREHALRAETYKDAARLINK